jgi:hypothetical protein
MTAADRRRRPILPPQASERGAARRVLWRGAGGGEGRLEASVTAEGALLLHHLETGSARRHAWGADAYDATLEIRREDLPQLALVLLKAGFGGQRDALELLRILCERRGVAHRYTVWN